MEKSPDSETYKEFKRVRNLINRRLREVHIYFCINFFQKLPTITEQQKFIKEDQPIEQSVRFDEIRLDSGEFSRDPKNMVKCLNRLFANLGVFKCSDIACKYPDILNIPELHTEM